MTAPDRSVPSARRHRANFAAAGVCIAFGFAYGVASLQLPEGVHGQLGPGSFPLLLAVALVLAGVLMLVPRFSRSLSLGLDLEAEEGDDVVDGAGAPGILKVTVMALTILAYVVLWPIVGMALSTLLIFAISTYVRRDRLVLNAVIAVLFTLFVVAVFELGLGIRLPGIPLLPGGL